MPVRKPPFSAERWTHIAICLENVNGDGDAGSELFIDGISQGKLNQPQRFTWDLDQVVIMLGIYYVGGIDEFAVFNRKLNQNEIDSIAKSKGRLIELPQ